MQQQPIFAFFPYLRTVKPIRYLEIILENSESAEGIKVDLLEHLKKLSGMFFLRDNFQIRSMTCLAVTPIDADHRTLILRRLREFQAIATFLYSGPASTSGRPFLRKEHGTLFTFEPSTVLSSLVCDDHNTTLVGSNSYPSPDRLGNIAGYHGSMNFRQPMWVAEGSRIYPPVPQMWLNHSQDLHASLERWEHSIAGLLTDWTAVRDQNRNLHDRLLIALEWYNRANSMDSDDFRFGKSCDRLRIAS